MKTIREIIKNIPINRIDDYFSIEKIINEKLSKNLLTTDRKINIAILASSTTKGIKEVLKVQCGELNLLANIYESDYNQYSQEILNPASNLYKSQPDLIIMNIDIKTLAGEIYLNPYNNSEKSRKNWSKEITELLIKLVKKITNYTSSKIILHNLEIPVHSSLGLMESKQSFGFIESIQEINLNLRKQLKSSSQIFMFDYELFCSKLGKDNTFDYKMYYLGDLKFTLKLIPLLCREYIRFIRSLFLLTKKCIVLDLDNTLWGGILGESGKNGIHLGPTPEGKPYLEFQQYLLALFNRGVILTINSKNNSDEALEVIRTHPHMVLRENHFAAIRINWNDKIANMRALAEEINIGIDSFVFIDDDSFNKDMVRKFLPEVEVVDMPKDHSLYLKTIMELTSFDNLTLTKEDFNKGKMYSQERQRRKLSENITDLSSYFKMLDMKLYLYESNDSNIARIAQLTQKTNQFNMTTKRYSDEAILKIIQNKSHRVFSIKLIDKFGDYGLTGVAILDISSKDIWKIDTFLLSCRIIGRNIEQAILAYIIQEAKKEGVNYVIGEFIPSEKNHPAKDFYKKMSLEKKYQDNKEFWHFDIRKKFKFPNHIKLIIEN